MEQTSMESNSPPDAIEFFDALVQYETRLWAVLERHLAEQRLPGLGRIWAARSIRRHTGAARVYELHRDLGITAGAASKLVDRLVHDGLVTRQPHPDDRRSSLLSLTEEGDRALDQGMAVIEAALADTLAGDETTIATVADGLHRLDSHLDDRIPA